MKRDDRTEEQESDTPWFMFTLILLFGFIFGFIAGAAYEHMFGLWYESSHAVAPHETGSYQETLTEEDLEEMKELGIMPNICRFPHPPDYCP